MSFGSCIRFSSSHITIVLFQALQRENFASKFLEVNEKIEKALDDLSYRNLHISEEVLEQVI